MKPKSRLNWFPAAGACVVTVCIQAVHADTGWTGASDTDFNNAGNWDNGVPAGQNARINTIAGNIATISANAGQMNEIFVARGGSPGLLRHSAGTASTGGWMDVGTDGGTGTYNLANFAGTGGTLTGLGLGSGSMSVGSRLYVGGTGYNDAGGTGTVNINTSGTLAVAGDIYVGKKGTGVINMDAGTLNRTAGWSVIGMDSGGNGAFNMSGGTVTAAGDTVIGLNAGSTGALNMTGGTYTTGGQMHIGQDGGNGTVNIGGAGTLTANSWLLVGTGNAGATGTLNTTGGTVNANSWLFVGDGAGNSGTINMSGGTVNAKDYTVIGKNGGTGTVNISSTGTFNTNGGLVLGGDGGTGTLNMTGGTLNQGTADGGSRLELTNGGSTGNATVNLDGGTLAVNGIVANGTGAGTVLLNLNGGTLKANIGNNDFINAGNIDRINVRNGGAVIDTNGNNIRIVNALLHSNLGGDSDTDGGLTKNGAGTLTLSNANTYSGGTTVNAGRIEVTNNTALGSGVVSIAAGANVLLNANSLTIANDFTLNGTTSGGALVSGDRPGGNVTTLSGTITLAASSNIASWWNDKQLTLSGKITGSGNLTFDRATALGDPVGGKFLISGATNDYTGSTTVNGRSGGGNAILQLGAANALPTGTTLTLNDANLSLLGFNQTLGGLVASTTTSQIVNGNATAMTLTVNNAAANTFAGVLGGFGTNENDFALTKGGAGTLTLSGANTYTGPTNVNAGTLKVSGSISSSAVTVANNGILASGTTGTIGSSVSVNSGGTLAAGGVGAIGTATVGSGGLALSSGSIFAWDLSGATGSLPTANQGSYDKVVSNGTMSGTSIFNVVLGASDFTNTFWDTAHTWSDIFTGAGVPTDLSAIFTTFSGTDVNTNGSVTGQGGFSFNGATTLTWTAVPEPTTALSGLLLTAGLLRRRRKGFLS